MDYLFSHFILKNEKKKALKENDLKENWSLWRSWVGSPVNVSLKL